MSGCEPLWGISRDAPIDVDPTPECFERVLRSMPEISTVTHEPIFRESYLFEEGEDVTETFSYEGLNHVRGFLSYTKDNKGKMSLSQYYQGYSRVPERETVIAARPLMMRVEIALEWLESQCGLHNLASRIKEWCSWEQCSRMP
jgi:hypothetical protein